MEAEGPSRIQIEPTPAHELETQVSVDQPGQDAAGCDHRDRVDDGDQGGHAEVGIDEVGCRLMAAVEVSGAGMFLRLRTIQNPSYGNYSPRSAWSGTSIVMAIVAEIGPDRR
jgi:hypothetical protein